MFDDHARSCVGISALLFLLSFEVLAAPKPPKVCAAELAFVINSTVGSRPSQLALNEGQPDVRAGLREVLVIRAVADARKQLERGGLPRNHRQALEYLRDEHFALGQVYTLSEFGLSKWQVESELDEWLALREILLTACWHEPNNLRLELVPRIGFDWGQRVHLPMRTLLNIIGGRGDVAGIDGDFLRDLRESYALAVSVADAVHDKQTFSEIRLRHADDALKRDQPERAFDLLYEERVRYARLFDGKRAFKLPISYVANEGLHLDDASALQVLRMIVRRPLLERLERAGRRELHDKQLVMGGLFPELVPMLILANRQGENDSMSAWREPDDHLLTHYAMNVGPVNVYEIPTTWPAMLATELTQMGFEDRVGVSLALYRREIGFGEPGPLEVMLHLQVNEIDGAVPPDWMEQDMAEIARAIDRINSHFQAFDDVEKISLRQDLRPFRRQGPLRLELIGAGVQTYVHLFEIASEFSRYETAR